MVRISFDASSVVRPNEMNLGNRDIRYISVPYRPNETPWPPLREIANNHISAKWDLSDASTSGGWHCGARAHDRHAVITVGDVRVGDRLIMSPCKVNAVSVRRMVWGLHPDAPDAHAQRLTEHDVVVRRVQEKYILYLKAVCAAQRKHAGAVVQVVMRYGPPVRSVAVDRTSALNSGFEAAAAEERADTPPAAFHCFMGIARTVAPSATVTTEWLGSANGPSEMCRRRTAARTRPPCC